MKRHPPVSPTRLFRAADALLAARDSREPDADSRIVMFPGETENHEPDDPSLFTNTELVQAMDLLIRMGYVNTTTRVRH